MNIGLSSNGRPFKLDPEAVLQTFAILAIRGAGKTNTAAVMAEEMCKEGLPWICFDPVGVWWGMRAGADGGPQGGYPVVVIGGEHADYPLDKKGGKKLASALMGDPICAVIDLSRESKKMWHTFVTDFCLELLKMNPEVPRHIFIEEAPEFVPQKARQDLTARCKEAIERFIRLGRNNGYGCTLISQRPATVCKDVLSQCENLFVLRTTGKHDRKALTEWVEGKANEEQLLKFIKSLAGLESGEGYFWSPSWTGQFEKIRIRQRSTFHPGATRTMGKSMKAASLCDVNEAVGKLKTQMKAVEKGEIAPAVPRKVVINGDLDEPADENAPVIDMHLQELSDLREQLVKLQAENRELKQKLEAVRKQLEPQFKALKVLFSELGNNETGAADMSVWNQWLEKAGNDGSGRRRMLEAVINRGELTKNQIATLAGMSPTSGTFSNYISWMKQNGLIAVDGNKIKLLNP